MKTCDDRICHYLNQKVGRYTRGILLYLSLILHDLGKKDTLTIVNGKTRTPNHEILGADRSRTILEQLGLNGEEVTYVTKLIQNHMIFFSLVNPENSQLSSQEKEIQAQHQDYYPELVLISMADTQGTNLNQTAPEEFIFRIDFYRDILQKLDYS